VGILFLISPEFIRVLIGERWLPMLLAFRLMLPYTLFDPVKKTMANLFIAVGKPEITVKIRAIQLVVMVAGMYVLGNLMGIEGVALAVDIMMLVGIILILVRAKEYVDYSLKKFFLTPFIAMTVSLALGFAVDQLISPYLNDILSGLLEIVLFSSVFLGIYYLLDKEDLRKYIRMLKKQVLGRVS
jgi:O-antigen/teichoic acid export membrane protein